MPSKLCESDGEIAFLVRFMFLMGCAKEVYYRPTSLIYIYRRVCVCVCVYPSGRIHVASCGPIGTKLGTRMEIHLEMVMGEIKITPWDLGGIWGVLGVRK